jgi:hypothetical protein
MLAVLSVALSLRTRRIAIAEARRAAAGLYAIES